MAATHVEIHENSASGTSPLRSTFRDRDTKDAEDAVECHNFDAARFSLRPRLVTTPNGLPPVNRNFEDSFGVTLKVVDAMMNKDIEMITSYKEGSRSLVSSLNVDKPPSDQKGTTVQTIVTKLKTNNVESQVPVFDESFSNKILTAWKPKILRFDVDPLKTDLGPLSPNRLPTPVLRDLKTRDTCNAVILVAFVAHCYHLCDNKEEEASTTTAEGSPKKSLCLWFKNCRPFAPGKHLAFLLDQENEAQNAETLTLFGFHEGLERLRDAVVTCSRDGKPGNHRTLEVMRKAIKKSEREVLEQLDLFRERLKIDLDSEAPSHVTILESFCKACPYECDHPNGHALPQMFGPIFDEEEFFTGLQSFFDGDWFKSKGAGGRSKTRVTTEATTGAGTSTAKGVKRRLELACDPLDQEVQSQPRMESPQDL